MKTLLFLSSFILSFAGIAIAVEQTDEGNQRTELTEDELESKVGRFGEVEEIPEDFQFSKAETLLWHDDHLLNIKEPIRLYYEFIKEGSFEEGFSDSVYLEILKLNDDGTKNARLDFFTADRKQSVAPDHVTNIRGNPVLGIYMQGDIYEMDRLTEGNWRHFLKQIKISLRKEAKVERITINFNGKEYKGEKVFFSPYLNDPHRREFEKFSEKYYELLFSNDIPGSLYQIKTVIPDKENATPLILEKLTLVDAKANK